MEAIALDATPRRLGRSDLFAFPIAWGCWRFAGTDVAAATRKIEAALDVGINLFDHADIYGGSGAAEELFGRVLAASPSLRPRLLVATKCGIIPGVPYDSSRDHIRRSAEASLRRLHVDVIDIFQIHRPDLLAHPEDVAAALSALRDAGKIREVGVSNFTPARFAALQAHLPFPIVTSQPELSPLFPAPFDDGTLDQCMQHRVTPLAWSPMAGGRLGLSLDEARALTKTDTSASRLVDTIILLDELAAREGVDRSAIVLAFLLAHPSGVIPILGTQREERIRTSVRALGVKLTRADWYRIFEAGLGARLP
jgi:predicted oxidoreductase